MDVLRFLLRLPFIIIRFIAFLLGFCLRLLSKLLTPLMGDVQWRSPWWLRKLSSGLTILENGLTAHPLRSSALLLGVLLVALFSWYGWHSYQNRPQPMEPAPITWQHVTVQATEETQTEQNNVKKQTIELKFSASAAAVNTMGQPIKEGITLSPQQQGTWRWRDDRTLIFEPKHPLPMGSEFEIAYDPKKLLAPQVIANSERLQLKTYPFTLTIDEAEFYQDPQEPSRKSALFSVRFNAPVDSASLEKEITLEHFEGTNSKKLRFTVNYDEKRVQAWVRSEWLALEQENSQVRLSINKGVKSSVSGKPSTEEIRQQLKVPGIYNLTLSKVETVVIDNDNNQPQRILSITASDSINNEALRQATRAWLLPQQPPKQEQENADTEEPQSLYAWQMSDITNEVLQQAQPVTLQMNDTEQDTQATFSFTYEAPSHRYLLLAVDNSIKSSGGYLMAKKSVHLLKIPDTPKVLRFMSQGSLLSLRGDRKVAVASRNLPGIRLELNQVIPDQLQHIISFKDSEFSSIDFDQLNPDYFTDYHEQKIPLAKAEAGTTQYQGIDLSRYLGSGSDGKRGIFLLNISVWDPDQKPKPDSDQRRRYTSYIDGRGWLATAALSCSPISGSSPNAPWTKATICLSSPSALVNR
ncbi:MAG: hypothetical protein ACRC5A_03725 [Enterobacteriaceae bacterium]